MTLIDEARPPAQFFFEIGYGACWAEAFVRNDGKPPFPLTDAVINRAWEIAPEAHEDPEEFSRYLSAANETQAAEMARLRGLLGEAEAGLEDVINPLRKIQRDADEQGARLSGMAYAVANDLHFVRDIARTTLAKLRAEKEDG